MLAQVTEVYPSTLTFHVSVQSPVYKNVDVEARIYLRQGHAPSTVRDRVKANLEAMLRPAFGSAVLRTRPSGSRPVSSLRSEAVVRVSEPDGTPNPLVDFGFYRTVRSAAEYSEVDEHAEGGAVHIKDADGNPVGEIAWSDVFNVIRDTEGVRKIGDAPGDLTLNGLPADIKLGIKEFPLLGNVTLTDGDTGGLL